MFLTVDGKNRMIVVLVEVPFVNCTEIPVSEVRVKNGKTGQSKLFTSDWSMERDTTDVHALTRRDRSHNRRLEEKRQQYRVRC